VSYDILDLVLQAGPIVKLVILILAAFSVVSWGIIVAKWRELRSAAQDSEAFLEVYHRQTFEAAFEAGLQLDHGPLPVIFLTCCNEMTSRAREAGQKNRGAVGAETAVALAKTITWTAARERRRLERGLSFLATVGSSAPFIGLFGTVIGIISTFQGIGLAGNASLAVVGPGMAEALVATAIGLLAAIPASMAYNAFGSRIDEIGNSIDVFSAELEADIGRMNVGRRAEPNPPPRAMGQ
jgi:biopolymer transport protein TolQ